MAVSVIWKLFLFVRSGKCGSASSRVWHLVRSVSTAVKICFVFGLLSKRAVSVIDGFTGFG